MILRDVLHYGIHFLGPFFVAFIFFRKKWAKTSLILLLGIVIDIDHLLAIPIFDHNRCSIGFHPLHSYWAIGLYFILFTYKPTRLLGIALLLHIIADIVDCLFL